MSGLTCSETMRHPVSFNSLPIELRDQIWHHTLAPRLIFIHPHDRLSPPHDDPEHDTIYDSPRVPVSVRFNYTTYSPCTTPATVFKAYAEFIANKDSTTKFGKRMTMLEDAYAEATGPLQYKSSAPPSALYVCSESRAAALREGYVLAFNGKLLQNERGERETQPWMQYLDGEDLAFWERNHLSEKGIWIEFKRDIIMLDVEKRLGSFPRFSESNTLKLLAQYSPADLSRVQKLALGGTMSNILEKLIFDTIWDRDMITIFSVEEVMPSLQELWVDDEFEGEGNLQVYYQERLQPLSFYSIFPNHEDARLKVERFLRNPQLSGIAAMDKLPVVKIVRGEHWHSELLLSGFTT